MKALRLTLLTQFLFLTFAFSATAVADIVIDHSEPLRQLVYERAANVDGSRKPGQSFVTAMRFDAFGREFELTLEENRG